nr:ABC transporter permease [Bdellovibrio sp. HAGR004]
MLMLLKLALRNLLRNKERTLLGLLMIIGSTSGLTLFRAFADDTIQALETVSTEMHFGHLQVAKNLLWDNLYKNNSERVVDNYDKLREDLSIIAPGITSVSGRMTIQGLMSNGQKTENVSVIGFEIDKEKGVRNAMIIHEGTYFSDNKKNKNEILVGHLLAKRLNLKINDVVTLVANSFEEVINAKDFVYVGSFGSGTEEIDKYFSYVDLSAVQELVQTNSVDNVVIRVQNKKNLSEISQKIQGKLEIDYPNHKVRDWRSLAELFRKVKSFYDTQSLIIQLIMISIVVLGILNSVSMSVIERIGEIGTLRSLGTDSRMIVQMIVSEVIMLSLAGVILGSLTALAVGNIINLSNIYTEIPGASMPIKINFLFSVNAFVQSSLLIVLTTTLASLLPVLKAVRINIVEALRRNI